MILIKSDQLNLQILMQLEEWKEALAVCRLTIPVYESMLIFQLESLTRNKFKMHFVVVTFSLVMVSGVARHKKLFLLFL